MFTLKPSPLTEESMLAYQTAHASGRLAVELARYKSGQAMSFTGPIMVRSSIFRAVHFESMLPYDMVRSLRAENVPMTEKRLFGRRSEQIRFLVDALEMGCVPILYVGIGAGHWITLWGFDEGSQEFLVFDSSESAEGSRGADGLSRYCTDKVIDLAQKQVLVQRICNLIGRLWPRFLAQPGTAIFTLQ